ncbi:helix-turn-helix domain-containing protein [Marinicaulis aureus]|uniref:Helix-turn-helix domain-containing protein n=1 Tax=Hyphococcus aureus TaxID=2666033 RepID=A0ABW1L3I1_9PROT
MKWTGGLALGDGWAFYRGLAGDNALHAHYAVQLVVGGATLASALIDGDCVIDEIIFIPSNTRHQLAPRPEPLDILYVEPALLEIGAGGEIPIDSDCAVLLYRKLEQELHSGANDIKPALFGAYKEARIVAAIDMIEQRLDASIRLEEIASACNLSKSRFAELFRMTTSLSLWQFVLWRRLRRAMLAIGGGDSATRAAHSAGFSDAAHFSRTLRTMFGVTPRDVMSTVAIDDPVIS